MGDDESLVRRPPHGEEPDEKVLKSPLTGNTYRVTEWEDLGDGRYRAVEKEQIEATLFWHCPVCDGYSMEGFRTCFVCDSPKPDDPDVVTREEAYDDLERRLQEAP